MSIDQSVHEQVAKARKEARASTLRTLRAKLYAVSCTIEDQRDPGISSDQEVYIAALAFIQEYELEHPKPSTKTRAEAAALARELDERTRG